MIENSILRQQAMSLMVEASQAARPGVTAKVRYQDVDDVLQTALQDSFVQLDRHPIEDPAAYFRAILRNVIGQYYTDQYRAGMIMVPDAELQRIAITVESIETDCQHQEALTRAHHRMRRMSPKMREIVQRGLHDEGSAQICSEMGITRLQMYMMQYRARIILSQPVN